MRYVEDRLLLTATDLSRFISCEHLVQLAAREARGQKLPHTQTAMGALLSRLGGEHELGWIDAREAQGLRVKRFSESLTRDATTLRELESAAADTAAAMHEGWDVIYQPFFFDGAWQGRADFLVRVDRPSLLGAHAYEVYDAKLARHVRAEALLQLCEYSHHVEAVQGAPPERMHVVLGDGDTRSFLTADFAAYHRIVRDQVTQAVGAAPPTYPEKVRHCTICEFAELCDGVRRADDHLSLVARMRRDQARKLNAAGVARLADLGRLAPEQTVSGLAQATLDSLREQARLQLAGRERGGDEPLYELLTSEEAGFGLSALPEPSAGDVFFDMEGDGLHEQPLEYLFGAVEVVEGAPVYRSWLGHTPAEERRAFEDFIDWVMRRLDADPAMHVYHYADYERSALQRLMGRHGTREVEVDRLLRGGVMVDLYRMVRQSLRLSTESYGLKAVERLYMPARTGDVSDAESSIVMYAEWRETGDPAVLESLLRYNEVDCRSTLGLRDWLEVRRREFEASHGVTLQRPRPRSGEAPERVADYVREADALRLRLTANLPEGPDGRDEPEAATWLLAQLLSYHRREEKVGWWRWFRLVEATEEELQDDRDALGPLAFAGVVDREKSSDVMRYRFEPQEHGVREGRRAIMPCTRDGQRTGQAIGQVRAVDTVAGHIDLVRGAKAAAHGHPRYLIPEGPVVADVQARALLRLGEWVAEHGIDAPGDWRAGRDLILRRPPRRPGFSGPLRTRSETASDAAVRAVAELEGGCLAVQGPPGSGKTHTAARMALDVVRRGGRVAVTATAHKVIGKLLETIAEIAVAEGASVSIVQRCAEDELCRADGVRLAGSTADVVAAISTGTADVAGGTGWLLATDDCAGLFDTLIVDEAGQMSLADVAALSRCARNLVLVGDPRQLAQVVQGSHPAGAGVSALEHLLGTDLTVPADRGIFLDRTWRMASGVCAFVSDTFYEGKLEPVAESARQVIAGEGDAPLSGLRVVEVEHDGDRTYSETEAQRVAALAVELLGRSWRHADGSLRRIGLDDILVVAPYNAHVACVMRSLPRGARVGTVDRFQGQEAAVSIFTMATSSTEDLPRNLEFLYSMNRLNVAVSRARCLSILVFSPALLRTRCHTPEQMRLVNALCRYAQTAEPWASATADSTVQLSLLPA